MNKCFKCGAEFEGKFCPQCGAKYKEKKSDGNLLQKSKAWLSVHKKLALIVSIILVATVILSVVLATTVGNKFLAFNVAKINLGDSYARVEKILGKPNDATKTIYKYYSNNVAKKMKQLSKLEDDLDNLESADDVEKLYQKVEKLTKEISEMEYKYITVTFYEGKVTGAMLDLHVNSKSTSEQEVKKITLGTKNVIDLMDVSNGTVSEHIFFTNGNYILTALPNNALASKGYYKPKAEYAYKGKVTWTDVYGEHSMDVKFDSSKMNFDYDFYTISNNGSKKEVKLKLTGTIPSPTLYYFLSTIDLPYHYYEECYPWLNSFYDDHKIVQIEFDDNVLTIPPISTLVLDESTLEAINVDENNPKYASLYGILFNKELTEIIYVPALNKNYERAVNEINIKQAD